jgi:KUP system potassium uptake protein
VSLTAANPESAAPPRLAALSLAALGVVFGDIGTSPLYTLKTVLDATGTNPSQAATLGALSLIVWTLIIVTTVKYVLLAMRVDNDGEGGILALMSLLGVKRHRRPLIVLVGLFGAALIYGDGAITPAISVLSALEGMDMVTPALHRVVLPLAAVILLLLFAVQRQGTARIGGLFGPVMALWFVVIAALGLWGIARHPAVAVALDPRYGLAYLAAGGKTAFLVLGGVFLCVTGAEALYADMGHFGTGPIRLAWSALVFPSLVLNYAGQAALVLAGGATDGNIFYRLCPVPLLVPLVLLATVATIIASQAIITGAFSMTRQAIQLGWLPRLPIAQTSAQGYGQIYVGPVNWLLMAVTLALTLGFGKSDNLAAAYGIAVSATMLMTSVLLFIAMREVWRWPLPLVCGRAGASRCRLRRRQPAQGGRWRIRAGGAGGAGLQRDADLASRHRGCRSAAARFGRADRGADATHRSRRRCARAGHGGVPDTHRAWCAAGPLLARAAQPRAARAGVHPDGGDRVSALGGRRRAAHRAGDRAERVAGASAVRVHGAAGRTGAPAART